MKKLLQELFALYQKDVYLYLCSLTHDPDLSEELTAEVFLEVVKSIHRFRGESDVKTWLFSIARHRWSAHLRQKKRQPEPAELTEFLEGRGPGPEDRLCTRAAADRALELLAREPERTQTVVRLRLEGLSFHEIGAQVGVSENSARVIDFRARAKIRSILNEEGFGDV